MVNDYVKFLDEKIDNGTLPGYIFGVFNKNGDCLFEHLNGKADIEKNVSITKDNIFRIASMTKPITGVACMKCQELGLLSIYDDVSKYLPDFENMYIGKVVDGKIVNVKSCSKKIKIIDILSHSSGLGSGACGNIYCSKNGICKNLQEQVCRYSRWCLDFEPGTQAEYSGITALDIVVRIIEIVSNRSYIEFITKYIFEPLEMFDTGYTLSDEQNKRVVEMYEINDERTKITHTPFGKNQGFGEVFAPGYTSGCAGLFSTFHDYRNFCLMLINDGVFNGKRIIKKESVFLMRTPQLKLPTPGVDEHANWGITMRVIGTPCEYFPLREGSYGWAGAFSTGFFIDPKDGVFALIMINLNNYLGSGAPTFKELEKFVMEYVGFDYKEIK